MKLVLAEKPSVAQSIAKVLGANERCDGYFEGNGYVVSWCVGHLVELFEPEGYDERYSKWKYDDLPIVPDEWKYHVSSGTRKQFGVLRQLMKRDDVKTEPMPVGEYRGFKMELTYDSFHQEFSMTLKGNMSHKVVLGSDARGNLIRLDNALANIPNRLDDVKTKLENLENQQKAAEAEIGKPFPQEKELTVKSARLAELDAELNMDDRKSPKTKEERPSVLADLKQRAGQIPPDRHKSSEREEVL